MILLNIFLIFIILYLCYKIFTRYESFNNSLNLTGKNMRFNKNLYVNYDISNNDTQEIKEEGHIDLSKNNLIIKNTGGNTGTNKVNIKGKLCLGSYCLDKSQLNLISGKVDAPQFKSKDDKDIYYNHDCNIKSSNPKHSTCIGDNEITSSNKLPHKLCFKSTIDNKRVDTCIESDKFDILLGNRGIKLKHLESNKDDEIIFIPTVKNIRINLYIKDIKQDYANIDRHNDIIKLNNNIELIVMDINKLFFNKYDIHFDLNSIKPSSNNNISIPLKDTWFINESESVDAHYDIYIKQENVKPKKNTNKSLIFTLAGILAKKLNPELNKKDFNINKTWYYDTNTNKKDTRTQRELWISIFYRQFMENLTNRFKFNLFQDDLEHVVISDDNINKMKAGVLKLKNIEDDINLDKYDLKYFMEIYEIINNANKLLEVESTFTFTGLGPGIANLVNILYNDKRIVPALKCFLNSNRKILHAYAKKYGITIVNSDSIIIKELIKYTDDSWKESTQKSFKKDKYIMPYYADFKQTSNGIKGTKDQLFFTNHHECVKNNTLYELNPYFNPRKYPYYKTKQQEINCSPDMCSDPFKARKCLHSCSESLLLTELKVELLSFNKLGDVKTNTNYKYTVENYEKLKTLENKYINNNYNAPDYIRKVNTSTTSSSTSSSFAPTTSITPIISPNSGTSTNIGALTDEEINEMKKIYKKLRTKLLSAEKLWNWRTDGTSSSLSKNAIYITETIAKMDKIKKFLKILDMDGFKEIIRLTERPRKYYSVHGHDANWIVELSSAINLYDKLYHKLLLYTSEIIDINLKNELFTSINANTGNTTIHASYEIHDKVVGALMALEAVSLRNEDVIDELKDTNYIKLKNDLGTYEECKAEQGRNPKFECRAASRSSTPPSVTTSGQSSDIAPLELIDSKGNMTGNDWHRLCTEENIPEHVAYAKGKKIYCLNKKSRDPNSISMDEVEKEGPAKKSIIKNRQGVRNYNCDGRPNWKMESAHTGPQWGSQQRTHIMDYDLPTKSKWPEVMLYGLQNLGKYVDEGDNWVSKDEETGLHKHAGYRKVISGYGDGYGNSVDKPTNKWVSMPSEEQDANQEIIHDYIANIAVPKMNSKLSNGRRIHTSLYSKDGITNKPNGFSTAEGILRTRMKMGGIGKWRKEIFRGGCCNCMYGYGSGTAGGPAGDGCKGWHLGLPGYPSQTGNHVNSCISDYNTAVDYVNEYDIDNDIGYYILPDTEDIDPDYDGYYIDDDNHNLKYTLKQSAVSTASKFLGNMDNHRVSHNGICGEYNTDLTNNHFFCFGKNKNNPLYNKICNPVTYLNKKVSDCVKEKKGISLLDEYNTGTSPVATTSSSVPIDCAGMESEDLTNCITAYNESTLEREKQYVSDCTDEIRAEENKSNLQELPNEPTHIDEFYDLNYFIEPSKNDNGDLLEANGYFHSHKHIHEDT